MGFCGQLKLNTQKGKDEGNILCGNVDIISLRDGGVIHKENNKKQGSSYKKKE